MNVNEVNLYEVRCPNGAAALVAAVDQTEALDVFMMVHDDAERAVCSVIYKGEVLRACD